MRIDPTAVESLGALMAAPNPFDGVSPDFALLGGAFREKWTRVLGAIWLAGMLVCSVYMVRSFATYAAARKTGYAGGIAEGATEVKRATIALAGLVALPALIGAVLTVIG
jgi:hypothetical protein